MNARVTTHTRCSSFLDKSRITEFRGCLQIYGLFQLSVTATPKLLPKSANNRKYTVYLTAIVPNAYKFSKRESYSTIYSCY